MTKLETLTASFAREQFPANKNQIVVNSHGEIFFDSEKPELNAQQND